MCFLVLWYKLWMKRLWLLSTGKRRKDGQYLRKSLQTKIADKWFRWNKKCNGKLKVDSYDLQVLYKETQSFIIILIIYSNTVLCIQCVYYSFWGVSFHKTKVTRTGFECSNIKRPNIINSTIVMKRCLFLYFDDGHRHVIANGKLTNMEFKPIYILKYVISSLHTCT